MILLKITCVHRLCTSRPQVIPSEGHFCTESVIAPLRVSPDARAYHIHISDKSLDNAVSFPPFSGFIFDLSHPLIIFLHSTIAGASPFPQPPPFLFCKTSASRLASGGYHQIHSAYYDDEKYISVSVTPVDPLRQHITICINSVIYSHRYGNNEGIKHKENLP